MRNLKTYALSAFAHNNGILLEGHTETGNSNIKLENESGVLQSEFGISNLWVSCYLFHSFIFAFWLVTTLIVQIVVQIFMQTRPKPP